MYTGLSDDLTQRHITVTYELVAWNHEWFSVTLEATLQSHRVILERFQCKGAIVDRISKVDDKYKFQLVGITM